MRQGATPFAGRALRTTRRGQPYIDLGAAVRVVPGADLAPVAADDFLGDRQAEAGIARVSKLVRAMKDFSHSGSRKRN